MTTNIAAWIEQTVVTDPYDLISFHGRVSAENSGPDSGYSWSAYVPFTMSPDDINTACITAATAVMTGHSITVGTCRLIGGPPLEPGSAVTTGAMTTTIATATSACVAVPAPGSAPSLALNTARQPSATRPTRVTVSGTWTTSLTASGVVQLVSDSSSSPTTVRVDAQPAVTLAVGIGMTIPWTLTYDVPVAHFYKVATSGTGTFAITRINETAG